MMKVNEYGRIKGQKKKNGLKSKMYSDLNQSPDQDLNKKQIGENAVFQVWQQHTHIQDFELIC